MREIISALPESMKDRAIESLTDYFRTHYFYAETIDGVSCLYGDLELTRDQLLQARANCFGIYYGMKEK